MKELIQSSGILMLRQVLTASVNIIRTKIVAVVLGPVGMGLLAQANQLQMFLDRIVNLGIGAGASKYTAEFYSKRQLEKLEKFIGELIVLLLASGTILCVFSVIFAPRLASWIFADADRGFFVILVAVALPMLAQSTVVSFVLRGTLKFKAIFISGVASALLALLVTIPLVVFFELSGAIWSITVSAAASFIIHWIILRKYLLKPIGLRPRLRIPGRESLVSLSKFGFVSLLGQVSTALTELLIRSSVILVMGAVANGLYHVAWSVSNQLFGIMVASLFGYGMPKLAATVSDPIDTNRTYNDLFRAYLLLAVPLGVGALITARWWIPLLFSAEFLAAESILPWQFAAQTALGFRIVLNTGMLVREYFRPFVAFTLAQSILHLGFYFFLYPILAIDAVPAAILLSHLIVGVPNYIYLAGREGLRLTPRVRSLFWSSLAVIVTYTSSFLLLEKRGAVALTAGIFLVWLRVNVKRGDVDDLIEVFKSGPIE